MDVRPSEEFTVELVGTYPEHARLGNAVTLLEADRLEAEVNGEGQPHTQEYLQQLHSKVAHVLAGGTGAGSLQVSTGEAAVLRDGVTLAYARLSGLCALDGSGVLKAERDLYKGLIADLDSAEL